MNTSAMYPDSWSFQRDQHESSMLHDLAHRRAQELSQQLQSHPHPHPHPHSHSHSHSHSLSRSKSHHSHSNKRQHHAPFDGFNITADNVHTLDVEARHMAARRRAAREQRHHSRKHKKSKKKRSKHKSNSRHTSMAATTSNNNGPSVVSPRTTVGYIPPMVVPSATMTIPQITQNAAKDSQIIDLQAAKVDLLNRIGELRSLQQRTNEEKLHYERLYHDSMDYSKKRERELQDRIDETERQRSVSEKLLEHRLQASTASSNSSSVLQFQLEATKATVSEQSKHIRRLQEQVESQAREAQSLQQSLDARHNAVHLLTEKARREETSLLQRIEALQFDNKQLRDRFASKDMELVEAQALVQQLKGDVRRHEDESRESRSTINALKYKLEKSSMLNKEHQGELQKIKDDRTRTETQQLVAMSDELQRKMQETTQLALKVDELKTDKKLQKQTIVALSERIDDLQIALERARSRAPTVSSHSPTHSHNRSMSPGWFESGTIKQQESASTAPSHRISRSDLFSPTNAATPTITGAAVDSSIQEQVASLDAKLQEYKVLNSHLLAENESLKARNDAKHTDSESVSKFNSFEIEQLMSVDTIKNMLLIRRRLEAFRRVVDAQVQGIPLAIEDIMPEVSSTMAAADEELCRTFTPGDMVKYISVCCQEARHMRQQIEILYTQEIEHDCITQ
jgi:hypothetical protein